jgi:hypothetical protein
MVGVYAIFPTLSMLFFKQFGVGLAAADLSVTGLRSRYVLTAHLRLCKSDVHSACSDG